MGMALARDGRQSPASLEPLEDCPMWFRRYSFERCQAKETPPLQDHTPADACSDARSATVARFGVHHARIADVQKYVPCRPLKPITR